MSDVQLLRESERELLFAHRPVGGLALALLGTGFGAFPLWLGHSLGEVWLFVAAGALFALVGIGAAVWRYELRLDLATRTYTRRRGFWPTPRTIRGPLDDLEGVVLSLRWVRATSSRGGRREQPRWEVSLRFRGWDAPVGVADLRDERRAFERLESLARQLRTWAIDGTGDVERRRRWDELDRPLAEAARPADRPADALDVDPGRPPAGSAITVTGAPGRRTILLPPLGFGAGLVLLVLFGLGFAGFGTLFLLVFSGLVDARVEGSAAGGVLVASVFVLVGLGVVGVALGASYGRERLEEAGDDLVAAFVVLGRPFRTRRLAKREIEEIDLRCDVSARDSAAPTLRIGSARLPLGRPGPRPRRAEVFIRSDRQIVRLGRDLGDADRAWLVAAVRALARSR